VISTADDEFGGSFTPDGKTIYFSRSAPHSYLYAIFESRWVGGKWTPPTIVPFSGEYTDSDPILSPVTPPGAIRAFRSRLVNGKWAEPENLSAAMGIRPDDAFLDLDIMVDPDERFLLVGSLGRPDGLVTSTSM